MNIRHLLPLAAAVVLGSIAGCQGMGSESDTSDETASGTTSSESSTGSSRRAEADPSGTTSGETKRCADGTMRTECPEDTSSSNPEPATSPGDTSGTPTQTPSPDTGTTSPPQ